MSCDITPELSAFPSGTPGANGAAGTNGTNGTNGVSSFTQLSASFVQPAISSNVVASVDDSTWIPVGITVFVEDGGYYTVAAVPSDTSVTLTNLGTTDNADPTDTVPSGGKLAPAGSPSSSSTSTSPDRFGVRSDITTEAGLAAIAVETADAGALVVFYNSSTVQSETWRLTASTAATVAGSSIRVSDYASGTKELVWLRTG